MLRNEMKFSEEFQNSLNKSYTNISYKHDEGSF